MPHYIKVEVAWRDVFGADYAYDDPLVSEEATVATFMSTLEAALQILYPGARIDVLESGTDFTDVEFDCSTTDEECKLIREVIRNISAHGSFWIYG